MMKSFRSTHFILFTSFALVSLVTWGQSLFPKSKSQVITPEECLNQTFNEIESLGAAYKNFKKDLGEKKIHQNALVQLSLCVEPSAFPKSIRVANLFHEGHHLLGSMSSIIVGVIAPQFGASGKSLMAKLKIKQNPDQEFMGKEYTMYRSSQKDALKAPYIVGTPTGQIIASEVKNIPYISDARRMYASETTYAGNLFMFFDEWNAYNETLELLIAYKNKNKCGEETLTDGRKTKVKVDSGNAPNDLRLMISLYLSKFKSQNPKLFSEVLSSEVIKKIISNLNTKTEKLQKDVIAFPCLYKPDQMAQFLKDWPKYNAGIKLFL